MNIFALSLLSNAEHVRVEEDQVTLVIAGVVVRYRKYLTGFDVALDVTVDGENYYSDYVPETAETYAQARLFFDKASEFERRPYRRSRKELRRKLSVIFGTAVAC